MTLSEIVTYALLCFAAATALTMGLACLFWALAEWFVERRRGTAIGSAIAASVFLAAMVWLLAIVIPTYFERIS